MPELDATPAGQDTNSSESADVIQEKELGFGGPLTVGDTEPLDKAPPKRAINKVKKGPLRGVSLILKEKNAMSTLCRMIGVGRALICFPWMLPNSSCSSPKSATAMKGSVML